MDKFTNNENLLDLDFMTQGLVSKKSIFCELEGNLIPLSVTLSLDQCLQDLEPKQPTATFKIEGDFV